MKRVLGVFLVVLLLLSAGCTGGKGGAEKASNLPKTADEAISILSSKSSGFKQSVQSVSGDDKITADEAQQLLKAVEDYQSYCNSVLNAFKGKPDYNKVKEQAVKDLTIMEEALKAAYSKASDTEAKKAIVNAQKKVQGLKRSLVGFGGLGCG